MSALEFIDGARVELKANVYFDGGVISHSLLFPDGTKKTVGVIRPGTYRFDTGAPERMDILAGRCRVTLPGDETPRGYGAGTYFRVPGRSSFEITVEEGLAEYLCSFEKAE
jgi:uncharacterized protein YaiE (UPF0345 family)